VPLVINPKELTQTMIRKAFVDHFYRQGLSFADLTTLAGRMRHSVNIAHQAHLKANIPDDQSSWGKMEELKFAPKPLQKKVKAPKILVIVRRSIAINLRARRR
jgi:hypothetical protein